MRDGLAPFETGLKDSFHGQDGARMPPGKEERRLPETLAGQGTGRLLILKWLRSAFPCHCGNLAAGPSILTSGGFRSANALTFAQSVVSPQNWGWVSFDDTFLKISPGVSQPLRMASRARCSSLPKPVAGSGRSCSHRDTAAGTRGKGASERKASSSNNVVSCVANALSTSWAKRNWAPVTRRRWS